MIHQVRTNKPDYWQQAPKVGLLLFMLLVCLPLRSVPVLRHPMTEITMQLQESTQRAIKAMGNPVLYGPAEVQLYTYADVTRVSRQHSWRTIFGEEVVAARAFTAPITALPRSPFGDARWSPITDEIHYEPFVKPTMGYFVGSLHAATSKANFQTAVNAAASTDIVEIQGNFNWTRTTIGQNSLANLIFPPRASGYVMVRDGGTAAAVQALAEGQRASTSTFALAYPQTNSSADSLWDFAPATQGWYFSGIRVNCNDINNARLFAVLPRNASTGAYSYSVANTPRYIIIQHCYMYNSWDNTWATNCRGGIFPDVEYCYIENNLIEGIAANGNESKGINSSNSIGKICVLNNSIEGMTETIMWGGALMLGDNTECAASDVYTARNYLYRRAAWMVYSATEFYYRNHKNFMEHKQGVRHVWERNECSGHSGIGQQQDFQIKHAGQGTSDQGKVYCHDALFRYNRMYNSAAPISIATSTNATYTQNGTYRIEIYGNLWWGQNNDFITKSSGVNRNLVSDIASNVKVITGIYVHHNTLSVRYCHLQFGGSLSTNANSCPNFRWRNNVDYAPSHQYTGFLMNAGVSGVQALNNLAGAGGWLVDGNVGISSGATPFSNVPGNYAVTAAQLQFVDAANGDYTLVDYSNYTGTDGGAPGVPYAHLVSMLSGVLNGDPA